MAPAPEPGVSAASPTPAATSSTPPPHPDGPPAAAQATFGPIQAVWTVPNERVAVYDTREKLGGKTPGTSTGYYVRLGGVVHGVHWDHAKTLAALRFGDTVNLHPAPNVVCLDDARCWRLMYVYPGRRAQPPLNGL